MKLTAIQVAGLNSLAMAGPPACFIPADAIRDTWELAKVAGKAELARELLQEAAHRGPEAVDCDLTGAARR